MVVWPCSRVCEPAAGYTDMGVGCKRKQKGTRKIEGERRRKKDRRRGEHDRGRENEVRWVKGSREPRGRARARARERERERDRDRERKRGTHRQR